MTTPNNRSQLKNVFEDESTFASTMLIALTDAVGNVDWFDWDIEAVRMEIQDRFDAEIPQENMDKIQALVLALTTNQFYVSLEAFIGICNSLAGGGADFRTFDPADMEEMCWAVTEVLMNDHGPELPLDQVFSEEIRHYIGTEALREGFKELPKPLRFGYMEEGYGKATEAIADPELFSAYFTAAKDQVGEVQDLTQQKVQLLAQQISELPFQSGDAESWQKFSGRALTQTGKRQPPAEAGRRTPAVTPPS